MIHTLRDYLRSAKSHFRPEIEEQTERLVAGRWSALSSRVNVKVAQVRRRLSMILCVPEPSVHNYVA